MAAPGFIASSSSFLSLPTVRGALADVRLGFNTRSNVVSSQTSKVFSSMRNDVVLSGNVKVKEKKEKKLKAEQKEKKHEKEKEEEVLVKVEAEVEEEEEKEGKVEDSSVQQSAGAKPKKIRFAKYQGLGNNFIMVDNRKSSEPKISPEQAVKVCDKNFGVGADGVIFVLPGQDGADYSMRIFNNDGSEPEMCGNGIRCMARFLAELEEKKGAQRYSVWTRAGIMVLELGEDGQVRVDMGPPTLRAELIPTTLEPNAENGAVVKAPLEVDGVTWQVTCVSMGNPHCVVFSSDAHPDGLDVSSLDLLRVGPLFENNAAFPARINTEFVEVISPTELRMRVWERGAGPTLACGTGACALVVAAVLEGRAERKCLVHLPGGPLEIEWNEDNRIYMTGPAEVVFHGKLFI